MVLLECEKAVVLCWLLNMYVSRILKDRDKVRNVRNYLEKIPSA